MQKCIEKIQIFTWETSNFPNRLQKMSIFDCSCDGSNSEMYLPFWYGNRILQIPYSGCSIGISPMFFWKSSDHLWQHAQQDLCGARNLFCTPLVHTFPLLRCDFGFQLDFGKHDWMRKNMWRLSGAEWRLQSRHRFGCPEYLILYYIVGEREKIERRMIFCRRHQAWLCKWGRGGQGFVLRQSVETHYITMPATLHQPLLEHPQRCRYQQLHVYPGHWARSSCQRLSAIGDDLKIPNTGRCMLWRLAFFDGATDPAEPEREPDCIIFVIWVDQFAKGCLDPGHRKIRKRKQNTSVKRGDGFAGQRKRQGTTGCLLSNNCCNDWQKML